MGWPECWAVRSRTALLSIFCLFLSSIDHSALAEASSKAFWGGRLNISRFDCTSAGFDEIFIAGRVDIVAGANDQDIIISCPIIRFGERASIFTNANLAIVASKKLAGKATLVADAHPASVEAFSFAASQPGANGASAYKVAVVVGGVDPDTSIEVDARGEDGRSGVPGAPGKPGRDGKNGRAGRNGKDGNVFIKPTLGFPGQIGGNASNGKQGSMGGKGGDGGNGGTVYVLLLDSDAAASTS
ncbi:collagen-like protein, partial [Mesorhizobium sp. B3-1-6]